MNRQQARQIAELLKQNKLAKKYTEKIVLESADNYVFIEEQAKIVACAEIKKVQWYQWEIRHVSVAEPKRGLGGKIVDKAEAKAKEKQAKIIQCTIRSDNEASIALFKSKKYSQGITFYNPTTKNDVLIFQKAMSILPSREFL